MLALQRPSARLCAACAFLNLGLLTPRRRCSSKASPQTRSSKAAKQSLENRPARTRFAPSPTGFLHMGSLRTALFNYLLARSTGGQFLLRLEDTDRTRIVPGAEARLYEDLQWAGLSWDEGPDIGGPNGPYRQSERLHHYRKYARQLLDRRRAYRCFCSKGELAASQMGLQADAGPGGRYPGTCLALDPSESEERAARGDPHVIRFKSSSEPVSVPDLVYHGFRKRLAEDDFIIIKSDGFPTYHFANVVDDHLMDVTHVIRGAEWLVSTPMHCDLYSALGWKEPIFAHVGLLVNAERQKLSKRNSDIQISSYKEKNMLPATLVNFVASLGWRAPSKKGILTLPQLVECFDLKFTKGDIVTDLEKLQFYQRKHIERLLGDESGPRADPELEPVVRSVANHIQAVEASRPASLASPQSSSPEAAHIATLGDIHHAVQRDLEKAENQDYIYKALRLLRNNAWPLEGVVLNNRYLFWRPNRLQLLGTLGQLETALGDVIINGSAGGINEALVVVRRAMQSITDDNWTAEELRTVLASLHSTIRCRGSGTGEELPHAIFKLWRWLMSGLDPGPPIHCLLELVGRRETLARLDLAAELASRKDLELHS